VPAGDVGELVQRQSGPRREGQGRGHPETGLAQPVADESGALGEAELARHIGGHGVFLSADFLVG